MKTLIRLVEWPKSVKPGERYAVDNAAPWDGPDAMVALLELVSDPPSAEWLVEIQVEADPPYGLSGVSGPIVRGRMVMHFPTPLMLAKGKRWGVTLRNIGSVDARPVELLIVGVDEEDARRELAASGPS